MSLTHAKNAMIILGSNYEQNHEQGFASYLAGEWDIYSIDIKPILDDERYSLSEKKTVYRIDIRSNEQLLLFINNLIESGYSKYDLIDSIHYLGSEQSEIINKLLNDCNLDVKNKSFISPLMQNSTLNLATEILPAAKIEISEYLKLTYPDSTFVKADVFSKIWNNKQGISAEVVDFIETCSTALKISSGINMTTADKYMIGNILNSHINYEALMRDLFID